MKIRHEADPADFQPALLQVQSRPPAPLGRGVLYVLLALVAAALAWAALARLDIVAVADGKLVPSTYLKIVQPAEQGIVKEILVKEGEAVQAGQVLIRMDSVLAGADVQGDLRRVLQQAYRPAPHRGPARRQAMQRDKDDPPELYAQVEAQYAANVRAYENALAQELAAREGAP